MRPSRLESGRNPARKPHFRPGRTTGVCEMSAHRLQIPMFVTYDDDAYSAGYATRRTAPDRNSSPAPRGLLFKAPPKHIKEWHIISKSNKTKTLPGAGSGSIFGVWPAPGAREILPKGGEFRPPRFKRVSRVPGAGQTTKIDLVRVRGGILFSYFLRLEELHIKAYSADPGSSNKNRPEPIGNQSWEVALRPGSAGNT